MKPFVVAFSGPIASGKTTIASAVAESLGWKLASFGRVVRAEAHRRGLDTTSRETLQRLGSELIDRGWEEFCDLVLSDAGWKRNEGLVIDGIRHIEALNTLGVRISPQQLALIHVHTVEHIRKARLHDRDGFLVETVVEMDRHETELQVHKALACVADLVVDGALPISFSVRRILEWLGADMSEIRPLSP